MSAGRASHYRDLVPMVGGGVLAKNGVSQLPLLSASLILKIAKNLHFRMWITLGQCLYTFFLSVESQSFIWVLEAKKKITFNG